MGVAHPAARLERRHSGGGGGEGTSRMSCCARPLPSVVADRISPCMLDERGGEGGSCKYTKMGFEAGRVVLCGAVEKAPGRHCTCSTTAEQLRRATRSLGKLTSGKMALSCCPLLSRSAGAHPPIATRSTRLLPLFWQALLQRSETDRNCGTAAQGESSPPSPVMEPCRPPHGGMCHQPMHHKSITCGPANCAASVGGPCSLCRSRLSGTCEKSYTAVRP